MSKVNVSKPKVRRCFLYRRRPGEDPSEGSKLQESGSFSRSNLDNCNLRSLAQLHPQEIVLDESFQNILQSFCKEHCHHFEDRTRVQPSEPVWHRPACAPAAGSGGDHPGGTRACTRAIPCPGGSGRSGAGQARAVRPRGPRVEASGQGARV